MIIAVDFDGILCTNKFPDIGEPNYTIIMLIRRLMDLGAEVILWTCRCGEELQKAISWCDNYGLRQFCAINDNAPSNKKQYEGVYDSPPRKIYADYYIDDHNIEFIEYGHWTYHEKINYTKNLLERLVHINEKEQR